MKRYQHQDHRNHRMKDKFSSFRVKNQSKQLQNICPSFVDRNPDLIICHALLEYKFMGDSRSSNGPVPAEGDDN
ncbi:hypothetical protein TNCV_1901701 [Trichonephila clavipes]|nr:hypothetical protein TNCV_1901701 [Trichonephila clavipes]